MKFRNSYSERVESELAGDIDCSNLPSLTKQSDFQGTDINFIMSRYAKTGLLPEMIHREPRYGDFSEVPDYQEALALVMKAEEQFLSLDAHIRARFENDPELFLAFATDPANGPEMIKLGLATPKPSGEAPAPSTGSHGAKKAPRAPDKDAAGGDSGES